MKSGVWPNRCTPKPIVKSMYSLPSMSHNREPAARSPTIGYSISLVEKRKPTVARLSASTGRDACTESFDFRVRVV